MTDDDFYYLNSAIDSESLDEKLFGFTKKIKDRTHCTGLVKVAPNFTDIYTSQTTWTNWNGSFNRIIKSVNLKLSLALTQSQSMHFSSYPGLIYSVDDFYTLKNT